MRRALVQRSVAASAVILALVCLSTAPAGGESRGGGGAVVRFNGEIQPRRLLRDRPLPISVTLSGSIEGEMGAPPPRLARLEIAFGARGGLDTAGLPRCPRARLRDATQAQALERCRGALVGRGTVEAEVPFNAAEPVLAHARVLAFNGRSHGRPTVWLHGYSATPPVSFVLPFYLHPVDDGAFGTLMRAPVASALGRWPRLRSFRITLGRRYRADGIRHSYLSASCPLPPRLHVGYFVLARATYTFSPRPRHSVGILRSCRVSR